MCEVPMRQRRSIALRFLAATLEFALCTAVLAQGRPDTGPKGSINYLSPGKETYQKLAREAEEMLRRDVLGVWFPRSVDKENGGFHSNFTRDWKRIPSDG